MIRLLREILYELGYYKYYECHPRMHRGNADCVIEIRRHGGTAQCVFSLPAGRFLTYMVLVGKIFKTCLDLVSFNSFTGRLYLSNNIWK